MIASGVFEPRSTVVWSWGGMCRRPTVRSSLSPRFTLASMHLYTIPGVISGLVIKFGEILMAIYLCIRRY